MGEMGERFSLLFGDGLDNRKGNMSASKEPDGVWDEYEWERFLQEQDRKTEKYMELLERFLDDPNRDQKIAKEMGWYHLLDKEGKQWVENVDALFGEEFEEDRDVETTGEGSGGGLDKVHPLYHESFALTVWIDEIFREFGSMESRPFCVKLAHHSAVTSAKLAAALSDDDADELGMTIAYLKRALREVTMALGVVKEVGRELLWSGEREVELSGRLFRIRDGIIVMMGECRAMWRRRKGGG